MKLGAISVPVILCMLFIVFAGVVYSSNQVVVDFLFWDPSKDPNWCPTCEPWLIAYEDFLRKNETVNTIRNNYTSQVLFNWIEYYSQAGEIKRQLYNITQTNSMIIKDEEDNFTIIEGAFNETYIREVIDAYLESTPPPPPPPPQPLIGVLALAFSLGFFETFSPCLVAMLSFILSYTIGQSNQFRGSMLKVMTFGIGFVSAAALLGLAVGITFLSMPMLNSVLLWILCIIVILLGFNLLGLLEMPFQTKPLIQKLTRKYVTTYTGLVVLGFLFYFLDPCIAPIFFAVLPLLTRAEFLLILLVFCLGVILPFVGIGFVAGSISKLTRSTYRHRSKIRAVSGLILIAYALYLIVFYFIL